MVEVKCYRSFNEQQEKWLELIKRHFLENLLMEKEDMVYLPIFTREEASWGKLKKVFDGKLKTIIHEINQAVAA
jgi:type I restriction enzyme R subunit